MNGNATNGEIIWLAINLIGSLVCLSSLAFSLWQARLLHLSGQNGTLRLLAIESVLLDCGLLSLNLALLWVAGELLFLPSQPRLEISWVPRLILAFLPFVGAVTHHAFRWLISRGFHGDGGD